MGPAGNGKFNNMYANTEFYKSSDANPTFTGNWVKQFITVTKDFPNQKFISVHGDSTAIIPELQKINNDLQGMLSNKQGTYLRSSNLRDRL
jgi:hypothetical protein